eukprot:CAMPEP_0170061828 /NCGR_PEP_ID=MMETSP0019_2-20121128/3261_1 /TAXON_ID=98059 /ORGANISM="Dinobryon sp., Strain UTEXLB2267" /LENGTH=230 /DNA_ID=CAMNT_0010267779 /DNA_START=405 /DNA_END=1097 /DNA_ORIENTATION=-
MQCLSIIAAKYNIWLSVGGFPEIYQKENSSEPTGKIFNSHVMIDCNGKIVSPIYRKVHLFDSPMAGLFESQLTQPGERGVLMQNMFSRWAVGLSVCYDLRFPALYDALSRSSSSGGVDIVLVPSAFTPKTGEAHWEVLLRARAIENQCYVLAAAQSGEHNDQRRSHGYSLIVDPWGTVLARLGDEKEGICYAELDRTVVDNLRRDMPVGTHKRLDVYGMPVEVTDCSHRI